MPALPPCQDCGACCFTRSPRHVLVPPRDQDRFGPDERARLLDGRSHLATVASPVPGLLQCVALVVRDGRFACSIYDRRPTACRAFEAGHSGCLAVREDRAEPVRAALVAHD